MLVYFLKVKDPSQVQSRSHNYKIFCSLENKLKANNQGQQAYELLTIISPKNSSFINDKNSQALYYQLEFIKQYKADEQLRHKF